MSRLQWLMFRKNGIGASEIGILFDLHDYRHRAHMFYDKISPTPDLNIDNMRMFMGRFMESPIAEMYQYWEGSQDSIIANYEAGKTIRRVQRVNAYIQNPKYPWLFVSLDRKINKVNGLEGCLEIKNTSGYAADKWESGVPPYHYMQVQQQILVGEFAFGDLANLTDGWDFDVLPFEPNPGMHDLIINESKKFWDDVIEARKLLTQIYVAKQNFNYRMAEDLEGQLQMLEPPPDGSQAYQIFLKDKFRDKPLAEVGLITGNEEDYDTAVKFLAVKERMKALKEEELLHGAKLKTRIGEKCKMDFGKRGYISWNGSPRKFLVKIKS